MRLGRTIAAKYERLESESERQKQREKKQKRKVFNVVVLSLGLIIVFLSGFLAIKSMFGAREERVEEKESLEIKSEVVDENGVGELLVGTRRYIARIERDLGEYGQRALRVILPKGKTREIDIYLEGREEYYKCNLDRGTAETAESISQMLRYLKERGIGARYVDVRVEGKGYYLP